MGLVRGVIGKHGLLEHIRTATFCVNWVAVTEMNFSYFIGETILATRYVYIYTPIMVSSTLIKPYIPYIPIMVILPLHSNLANGSM